MYIMNKRKSRGGDWSDRNVSREDLVVLSAGEKLSFGPVADDYADGRDAQNHPEKHGCSTAQTFQ